MKKDNKSFLEYIEDMLESIDKILKYISSVDGMDDFLENDMIIDAVTRKL